jgi:5-methyltetrahydrofolate--homocysteine methyltransferase
MYPLQFTEEAWERVERDTMAWWAGELERPLVWLAVTDPVERPKPYGFMSNYPLSLPAEALVDCYAPHLAATRFYGDAFPWVWVNFGPGILAGVLGAQVHSVSEPSETVWFTPREKIPIEEMQLSLDPENVWWKRVKEITSAFLERYDGLLQVSHTDLGGNLDILASFRETQQLLFDVVEQPEEVLRLSKQITAHWLRCYNELDALIRPICRGSSCWTPVWSSGKTYMLQCDFSYMISPAMFEKFVLPDLAACCDTLDHGFYHLDGKGEIPHLDLLLSIPRLSGIQWIPGDGAPPPEDWLPLLKRIRDGGKRCQVFVTPEGARKIVDHLGGRGFLFVIYADHAEFPDAGTARAFLRSVGA